MCQCRVLDYVSQWQQVVYSCSASKQDCVHVRTVLRRTVLSPNPRNLVHLVLLEDIDHAIRPGYTRCFTRTSGYLLQESAESSKDSVLLRIVETGKETHDESQQHCHDKPRHGHDRSQQGKNTVMTGGAAAEFTFRSVFPEWANGYRKACASHCELCHSTEALEPSSLSSPAECPDYEGFSPTSVKGSLL
eukprot:TRINITY_DN17461_c0_g1_i2.p1 TRINITY_DN17461_c0_g1~~TRINITY_DN17461_c0_g1_i2.p1  ORF type:complete len:190 (-),score=27.27 TRINITY_DN17461_c0_g1_i2:344-913(-)